MIAAVGALEHVGRRGELELDLDDTVDVTALHLEAGVAEHAQHRTVLGQHLRDEALDADAARMHRETLEQPAPDAPALHVVRDDEGDLGARRVAQPDERPERDDPRVAGRVGELGDERERVLAVAVQKRHREMCIDAHRALKAQMPRIGREPLEELDQRRLVVLRRLPQPQRRAVPEDDVFPHLSGHHPRKSRAFRQRLQRVPSTAVVR